MSGHSVLAPSSAARWLACTLSARREQGFPDTTSESAKEGTFAHEWAEAHLRYLNGEIDEAGKERWLDKLRNGKSGLGDFYSGSLEEYVDEYIDFVWNEYLDEKKNDPDAVLLLEKRLDFSSWARGGFGRGDAVIMGNGFLEIIDLKYGRSIAVQAEDNPQLQLYALGAVDEYDWLYDFSVVSLNIVQPRNGGISTCNMGVHDLRLFGNAMKPLAEKAYKGEGEAVPGEWCRFCKAACRCKELALHNLEPLKEYDKSEGSLTDEDIAAILGQVDFLTNWVNKIKNYALVEARDNGRRFPGYKLVEGRSNRKITDPDTIKGTLIFEGYKPEEIMKPEELQSLTNLEKLVGKKKFGQMFDDYIIKPPGKPTLVPESDPRPEFGSAEEDFEDIPDEPGAKKKVKLGSAEDDFIPF